MSYKKVVHADSAISPSCKMNMHTHEILRSLLNGSRRLDWETEVASKISVYLSRMMEAGYPERYRGDTLERCLRMYDRMLEEDTSGIHDVIERRREKQRENQELVKQRRLNSANCCPPHPQH